MSDLSGVSPAANMSRGKLETGYRLVANNLATSREVTGKLVWWNLIDIRLRYVHVLYFAGGRV